MTLPNFLVIGAMKAGTTSLYSYLEQHPDVFMSPNKEPRFFALENDPLDYRGPDDPAATCEHKTLAAYETLYEGVTTERAIGEASTLYLYHPDAPARIRHHVPEARIVAVLRHPVERAYSNWVYTRRDGREPLEDFAAALEAEDERVAARWGPLWHYRRKGFYGEQLARYYALFPREQIRIHLYEDLRRDPVGLAQDVFAFLGVDPGFVPDVDFEMNVSGIPKSRALHGLLNRPNRLRTALGRALPERLKRRLSSRLRKANLERAERMTPGMRRELTAVFRDDILRLQALIGRDLSAWLDEGPGS